MSPKALLRGKTAATTLSFSCYFWSSIGLLGPWTLKQGSFSTKTILRTTPVMLLLGLTPWLLTKLCCVSSQRHWDRWPGTRPTQHGKLQKLRQIATNGCVSMIRNSTYYDVVLCWPTYWFIFLEINLISPWPTCCTWLAVDWHLVAIWPLYLVRSIIPDVSLPFLLPQGDFPLALWGSLFPH